MPVGGGAGQEICAIHRFAERRPRQQQPLHPGEAGVRSSTDPREQILFTFAQYLGNVICRECENHHIRL